MISRTSMKSQMKGNKMKTKKMKDGKKVGSTPVPKKFTKALEDKYKDKLDIYGKIYTPVGKKSTRKRTTIEKIFGGGPAEDFNIRKGKLKKAGKKLAGNEMFKENPELMKRAKKEMKTNKMKKGGSVKKMKGGGMGKLASLLSPAYGIMKGQGPFSKIASMGPSTNALSVFAKSQAKDAKRRRAEMAEAGEAGNNRMTPMTPMMAGGPLKRKKSIDGCAMKGKTRGV